MISKKTVKPKRRNPKTACCWHCGRLYDRVWQEYGGTWGNCNACDSKQAIIAPSLNKKGVK